MNGEARMTRRLPYVGEGMLHEVGPEAGPGRAVGSPAWFAWLVEPTTHSFSFQHPLGNFTARKERRQRGDWYWSACARRAGRLRQDDGAERVGGGQRPSGRLAVAGRGR